MGIFDSLIGGIFGTANTNSQINAQQQNNAAQREWQTEENEKDRLWQQQEWTRQFSLQNEENDRRFQQENDEWERRFNLENEYNDPSAVIKRLYSAGINPAAAMGQLTGSAGLAAAGGSSSPGMPNVTGTQMMPSHSVSPMGLSTPNGAGVSSISDLMSGLSSLISAKAKAKEVGLKEVYQAATLDADIRQKLADAGRSEALASYTKFQQTLGEVYETAKIDAETKKLLSEVDVNIAKAFSLEEQGKTQESVRLFNQAMTDLTNTKDKALTKYLPFLTSHVKSMIGNLDASAENNRAQAGKASAETITIDALREGQVHGQDLDNLIKDVNRQLAELNFDTEQRVQPDRIEAVIMAAAREKYLTEEQKERALIATKERKWYTVRSLFDVASKAAATFRDAAAGAAQTKYLITY